jgi:hypothetical protein
MRHQDPSQPESLADTFEPSQLPGPACLGTTMRALVQDLYGSPDVLKVAAVPVPTPDAGQVRIRVAAASVNARAGT